MNKHKIDNIVATVIQNEPEHVQQSIKAAFDAAWGNNGQHVFQVLDRLSVIHDRALYLLGESE
jgi:hypothetical protein